MRPPALPASVGAALRSTGHRAPFTVWPSGPRTLRWTCSTTTTTTTWAAGCRTARPRPRAVAGPAQPRGASPSSRHPLRSTSCSQHGRHHRRRSQPSATAAAAVRPRARVHSPRADPPVAQSARRQSVCRHGARRPGRRVRHRGRPRKGGPRGRAAAAGSE